MKMTPEQLVQTFVDKGASDLYLTLGAPPSRRMNHTIERMDHPVLTDEDIRTIMAAILPEEVVLEFESTLEYNTAIDWKGIARLRINLFRQRQHSGMVMRRIRTEI